MGEGRESKVKVADCPGRGDESRAVSLFLDFYPCENFVRDFYWEGSGFARDVYRSENFVMKCLRESPLRKKEVKKK